MRGLQPAEIAMLELLQEIGPATSSQLAEEFGDRTKYSESTGSSCLNSLKETGLVDRRPCIDEPVMFVWETANPQDIPEGK